MSSKRDKEKLQAIQVFVRCRPLNKQEQEGRSLHCIDIISPKEMVVKQQFPKSYTFDRIFGPCSRQIDIYNHVMKPIISEILAGYNCTVFAYGQTGTGKTYTMAGGAVSPTDVAWQSDLEAGIIPRAMSHLFDELGLLNQQYTVQVSYLELYNEELVDLLCDIADSKNIRLYEDQHQKGSVIISGLTKETVHNKDDVYSILQKGQERRRFASTLLNAQSSRSHTVFSIMVHTCETTSDGEELVKTGKLNLVDLAGSENISRSGAVDRRAREAGNINQSLLTLGRVIKALVERSPHIPYRESKLTRILQDSLGGRTKTSIIATVSPAVANLEETISTLDYANRARNITNRPEVNQRLSQKAWKAQFEKEIERLRKDLHAAQTGSGVYVDQQNYARMLHDKEAYKEELAEKINLAQELEQQIRVLEEQRDIQELEWKQLQASFEATRVKLIQYKSKLKKTLVEMKEQEHLADSYEAKAESLHEEARSLIEIAKSTINVMQKKLENLRVINKDNTDLTKAASVKVVACCEDIIQKLLEFKLYFDDKHGFVFKKAGILQENCTAGSKAVDKFQMTVLDEAGQLVNATCSQLETAYDDDRAKYEEFLGQLREKLQYANEIMECIDFKTNLELIRKNLMADLNDSSSTLERQKEYINKDTTEIKTLDNELENISKMVDSARQRLCDITANTDTIKYYNMVCTDQVNSAVNVLTEGVVTVIDQWKLKFVEVTRLLLDVFKIIEENEQPAVACLKMLDQLTRCKDFFAQVDAHESTEAAAKNIKENTLAFNLTMRRIFSEMINDLSELGGEVTTVESSLLDQKDIVTEKVEEIRDTMFNLTSNELTTVFDSTLTPARIMLDPNALPQPSPRERVLSRFRSKFMEPSSDDSFESDEPAAFVTPLTSTTELTESFVKPASPEVAKPQKKLQFKKPFSPRSPEPKEPKKMYIPRGSGASTPRSPESRRSHIPELVKPTASGDALKPSNVREVKSSYFARASGTYGREKPGASTQEVKYRSSPTSPKSPKKFGDEKQKENIPSSIGQQPN